MKKIFFWALLILAATTPAFAAREHLSDEALARVEKCKNLTRDVDARSVPKIVKDLERTDYPDINLLILESIARTYDDLVREHNVVGQKKKNWLFGQIKLNMAYLQLTGGEFEGDKNPLNRKIRKKLKQYLPSEILTDPGFFQKVDELLQ